MNTSPCNDSATNLAENSTILKSCRCNSTSIGSIGAASAASAVSTSFPTPSGSPVISTVSFPFIHSATIISRIRSIQFVSSLSGCRWCAVRWLWSGQLYMRVSSMSRLGSGWVITRGGWCHIAGMSAWATDRPRRHWSSLFYFSCNRVVFGSFSRVYIRIAISITHIPDNILLTTSLACDRISSTRLLRSCNFVYRCFKNKFFSLHIFFCLWLKVAWSGAKWLPWTARSCRGSRLHCTTHKSWPLPFSRYSLYKIWSKSAFHFTLFYLYLCHLVDCYQQTSTRLNPCAHEAYKFTINFLCNTTGYSDRTAELMKI